jgi:uncharacterized membrane protein
MQSTTLPSSRIESIDLLRGVVIVIMALDHVRDYFHADAFLYDPTDLTQASVVLFFTRWITHFCAPVFVFLAGTSAYQIGIKKGIPALSSFLLKRGLWLILLELTVINFAWFFNITFSFIALTVIWALGVGMVALAGLVYIRFKWILGFAVALIIFHNAFDGIHFSGTGMSTFAWSIIRDQNRFSWGVGRNLFVGYALVPWVGVMALGYCFGSFYTPSIAPEKRRKILIRLGVIGILLFIALRWSNVYGDPIPWSVQPSSVFTFLSFLNTNKYPPSLLYLLMTLAPSMLFLAFTEHVADRLSGALIVIGRVPLFFYIVHIYVVHIVALFAAVLTGHPASHMVFDRWITNSAKLTGYGFSLGVVYLIWILVIVVLYPLCKWYEQYKRNNKDKVWLSYL